MSLATHPRNDNACSRDSCMALPCPTQCHLGDMESMKTGASSAGLDSPAWPGCAGERDRQKRAHQMRAPAWSFLTISFSGRPPEAVQASRPSDLHVLHL